MNEEGKDRGVTSGNPPQHGNVEYPPQPEIMAFSQQSSPSATSYSSAPPLPHQFYGHEYQAGPVSEGRPTVKGNGPLLCGIGLGWILLQDELFGSTIDGKGWRGGDSPDLKFFYPLFWFILGFFLGVIPWYIGAIMLCCVKDYDNREKPGFIACAIAAVIATIAIIAVVGLYNHNH